MAETIGAVFDFDGTLFCETDPNYFDYTLLKYGRGLSGGGSLVSAGAEVTARLAHFLWLPFPTSAGIVFDWNGGSEYDPIEKQGIALTRTYVGGVFSIDF